VIDDNNFGLDICDNVQLCVSIKNVDNGFVSQEKLYLT